MESHSINILALFWQADIFVKGVMLLLVVASVWSWSIIISKIRLFSQHKKHTQTFSQKFWNKNTVLEELFLSYENLPPHKLCPMSSMFCAAFSEYKILSSSSSSHENLITSVDRAMVSSMNKNISIMEHALIILSSISSAAPFVGLLGTVWGIMNSFSAIASSQQTNLTVVAPGIAEALLATALGLIAAIPANIAYNRFASTISHSTSALENFRNDFLILISRSLHSS
jgi:biopolymer transport protein TolQ